MNKMRFKRGAASFYIVAFSTLILMIIATSFATVVLSELARTANNDLSRSAYDSALAGIEDAKLAYAKIQGCLNSGKTAYATPIGDGSCGDILYYMNNPECDMVAKILGRTFGDNGVIIKEDYSSLGGETNNMQQAYTCVLINAILSDYSSTLTEADMVRAVKVRLYEGDASDVGKVKIVWGMDEEKVTGDGFKFRFSNIDEKDKKVAFPMLKGEEQVARPPMLSVGLVQTAKQFSLTDFESVSDGTNRGTVFLVPSDNSSIAKDSLDDNYVGAYDGYGNNIITSDDIIKSNDRTVKNLPFVVYCDVAESRNCSATLELPNVVGGGERSDETFMIVVSNPYGEPKTQFSLEFYDHDGNLMTLNGMQIEVDSTGRANNLYRRVMARLEPVDASFPYPLFGVELLGSGDGEGLLRKPSAVLCEYQAWGGFAPTC